MKLRCGVVAFLFSVWLPAALPQHRLRFTAIDPAQPTVAGTPQAPGGAAAGPPGSAPDSAPSPRSATAQINPSNARAGAGNIDWAALLPEGEGRLQTIGACATCHNLKYIVSERRADESGWTVTIERMIYADNAFIPEEEIPTIARYLARHFGPRAPRLHLPVGINSAPSEVLRMLPGITEQNAALLLDARGREKISDPARLESIVGKEITEKLIPLISFD